MMTAHTKDMIQYGTAVMMLVSGVVLIFCSFFIKGTIEEGVPWYSGQTSCDLLSNQYLCSIRNINIYTTDLTNKGYTVSQINRAKYTPQGVVLGKGNERTPLDWIDQHINSSIAVLADYVQEYYGDVALQQMLDNFGKMRIVKKG